MILYDSDSSVIEILVVNNGEGWFIKHFQKIRKRNIKKCIKVQLPKK